MSHGELRQTLMTIVICLVSILGNAIDCFLIIVDQFANLNFDNNGRLTIVCNVLLFASHGFNLVVYLSFNRNFQTEFRQKFKQKNKKLN